MVRSVALAASLSILAGGCQSSSVHAHKPLPPADFGSDADSQMEFWHALGEKKITTNDEAFHGVLLFLDGTDANADYKARVQAMKARHLLPPKFDEPADAAVGRGILAVTLVQALHIKGGLMLTVLGPTPRYALRELVFQGLYPLSSENQTFSGTEFLGVIGKMEDYQKTRTPTGLPPATNRPERPIQT